MLIVDHYFPYILGAYVVAFVVISYLVISTIVQYRKSKRALESFGEPDGDA